MNDSSCPPGHNTPLPLERSPPASFKRLLGRTLSLGLRRGHVPREAVAKVVEAALANPPILIFGRVASVQSVRQESWKRKVGPAELAMVVIPRGAPLAVGAPMKHDAREVLRVVVSDTPVARVREIRTPRRMVEWPPNEMRVSCGAMLERSQTDGLHRTMRRQLHARVRRRAFLMREPLK